MAFKYSKGSTVQGDIKAADDSNRDTMIDFEEDRIDLKTGGSTRFKISGSNGNITFNEAFTFPNTDGSNGQILKTDGSGTVTWQNESGGGGGGGGGGGDDFDESFSSITNATGDVDHNCSSTQTFLHTSISDSFVVNLTNFSLSSGESTVVTLILSQGNTAHFPSGIKIGGSAQEFSWKASTYPTPTANAEEIVTFKIINSGGNYLVLADVDSYAATVPLSPITSGSILYLDGSNDSSYNGSGTTWTDLSGQNNHGTLTNGPTFSSSTKLFTFDGSNDFVDLPDGFDDFSNGISLFFIASFGTGTEQFERLIDLSVGADVDNILFCRETSTDSLRYDVRDGPNGNSVVNASDGILSDTVASYAVVDNGTTTKIFRNGTLLVTSTTTNLPRNVTRTQNFIGKTSFPALNFLEGKMGVAAVYTRALSDHEIVQNHNYYVPIYSL